MGEMMDFKAKRAELMAARDQFIGMVNKIMGQLEFLDQLEAEQEKAVGSVGGKGKVTSK